MQFKVEQAVLDSGVKIIFAVIKNMDNHGNDVQWQTYRTEKLEELYARYEALDVKSDPILEGFHILHDTIGVKRRKNTPASENLIKLLKKHHGLPFINQAVDIYNLISLDTKLALGAHNMDHTDGDVTLRFTDGSERYVPLGQTSPVAVNPHEYCYCDDANEVLCRLEIRQVHKTAIDESVQNVFYIIQGNAAVSDELLLSAANEIICTTTRYCGGTGSIVRPEII